MVEHSLLRARKYEEEQGERIPCKDRPAFHFTPRVGWTNDPNGFSYFGGRYHLFYQYNPYDVVWDSMHWGHAVSSDLLTWEYLPAALAPDEKYDSFGCFSGSATELTGEKQLLMYTGVRKDEEGREFQVQCIATGDGRDYVKFAGNPVIDSNMLPEGFDAANFRDPKIFKTGDGGYACVVAAKDADGLGVLLMFLSRDGHEWKYRGILDRNSGEFGRMWECPDFFFLDGKAVILVSPQEMAKQEPRFHGGNGTLVRIGSFDENECRFVPETDSLIDHGIDFYAPQTVLSLDGRRIMIAWMQNWETCNDMDHSAHKWFGQMCIPRELSVKEGRLYQRPVKETESLRREKTVYTNVLLEGKGTEEPLELDGINGRCADMEMELRPLENGDECSAFELFFAADKENRTVLRFIPSENTVEIDRTDSGTCKGALQKRSCKVTDRGGRISLRVILDRYSAEVFINDGEKVLTTAVFTDADATAVRFAAKGRMMMDIVKYTLAH